MWSLLQQKDDFNFDFVNENKNLSDRIETEPEQNCEKQIHDLNFLILSGVWLCFHQTAGLVCYIIETFFYWHSFPFHEK